MPAGGYRRRVDVYRATDPQEREWRIEITATAFRATVFAASGRGTMGTGIRLAGVDALAGWLVEHGLSEADLRPATFPHH